MGITVSILLMLLYKLKGQRFRFISQHQARHRQNASDLKDSMFYKWVELTEKNMKKIGIKINIIWYVALSILFSIATFFISMMFFKNVTASILISAFSFIIPEHLIDMMNQRQQDKISQQMTAAIRVFTAEFIQTPQIERGFEVIGKRIEDPVGALFRRAHMELVIGRDPEIVLSRLAGQIDNEYGQMFIQLLRLAKHDSSTTPLFTDLLEKIENHLEMDRKNKIALTGERLLALFMTLIPIPAILIMSRVVPETMYFLTEVTIGRMITMLSFASMLVWIIIDKIVGRAEI